MERDTTKKKKEMMLTALEQGMGIVSSASKKANVSRTQHYFWMQEDADYKKAVEDITEMSIDLAEASLLSQIQNKNTSATIFYLKTKGKNRGYVERTEIIATGLEPIRIEIIENGSKN